MDPLFKNKLAGAVLGTLLVGFAIIEVSHQLYPNPRDAGSAEGGHGETAGEHATDTPVEVAVDLGTLMAAADATGGQRRFAICAGCHSVSEGGPNSVGPNLWDVVGRPVASVDGFNYSGAMQAVGGDWTYERLFEFLESPSGFVSGTSMSYGGMRRDTQRADVLAYLSSLSNSPVAFPAAGPAPAPAAGDDHGEADSGH